MKKLFNWTLALGSCVAAFYLVGLIVPRNQSHSTKTNLTSKPEAVYGLVSDLTTWPHWHPNVSRVEEREKRKDHPVWRLTDKKAQSYEIDVVEAESPSDFAINFERDGTRYMLRFDLSGLGEGTRLRISQTVDTRDTWQRAQHFLLPNDDVSPLALMTALANELGEKPRLEDD